MAKYTSIATTVLFTVAVLNNVCHPGWAASKGEPPTRSRRYSSVANVYGGTTRINGRGAEGNDFSFSAISSDRDPNYSDSDGDAADNQDHEDQLDQDDPVSTVSVTAVRGSVARLPCDIGGGNNDGFPRLSEKSTSTGAGGGEQETKDSANAIAEDRAYMVLWFKYRPRPAVRHRNSKTTNRKLSSGGKPLYSYDVRGRPLREALHWSDDGGGGLGTRARFVVFGVDGGLENSTKAALVVANVTEQDAGTYRCRVDFRDSPTRNYRIILQVIVPPDKMTIVYNGMTEIGGGGTRHVVGPVPEGGRLVLVCKVHGGKPKPRVQWYSADGQINSPFNTGRITDVQSFGAEDYHDENIATKSLVINQLNRNHANDTYTCLAGNDENIVESNIRMTVLINMYLNVQNVRIIGIRPVDESENTVDSYQDDNGNYNNNGVLQGTVNLISGKWYTGECLADGASPKAAIEWSIDGNGTLADEVTPPAITARVTVIELTEHSSRMRFKPTPNDDGRYLRCKAYNPNINTTKDITKNKALLLNVQYPPIVKLNLGNTFDPGRIKTGDDVYFECQVLDGGGGSSGKHHNRIEWYHNGRSILQNGVFNSSVSINSDIKVVLLSAGTLVIRNVGHHHSGQYTCESKNELGTGRSRPVTLRVQYAPVCADDDDDNLQLVGVEKTDKTVRVTCRVRADPADDLVQFEWSVLPGSAATTADLHQQQSPSVVSTGNYVTSALSGSSRNNSAADAGGLVVGELVLTTFNVGVPDMIQYSQDRPSAGKNKPAILDSVTCQATNAVGIQQKPCKYYIIPASPPGPLSNCTIRLPKDQETKTKDHRHHHSHNGSKKRHRRHAVEDLATVNCIIGHDGGVRPVTYSLETYAMNDVSTPFFGSLEDIPVDVHRINNRGESLAENVTGTVTNITNVEYRVNRTKLLLKWDNMNNYGNGKYLRLSAYASNRIGRGPLIHIGSENLNLLRDPWWYNETNEFGNTKVAGPTRTSFTDWWETSDGGQNAIVGVVVITMTVMAITIVLFLLWRRRGDTRSSTTAETVAIAANLIATDEHAEDGTATDKKYTLLPDQQLQEHCGNVYPNLCAASRNPHRQSRGAAGFTAAGADVAPDIMIRPNYGKQFFVSIASHGIPGPESSV